MAKEICMITANEKGKQFRKYFIECEKRLKNESPMLTEKQQLALQLFEGGINSITAHKRLMEIEVKPLKDEIKDLEIKVDESNEYVSIKKMANINDVHWQELSWQKLKKYSNENGYTIEKVIDRNYGHVNAYHVDVWMAVYPHLMTTKDDK